MAVAKHFTETLDFSTTDLTTLRSALGYVSSDSSIATDALMTQLIADGLVGLTKSSGQSATADSTPRSDGLDAVVEQIEWIIPEQAWPLFTPLW
jgi:hypothetical protein